MRKLVVGLVICGLLLPVSAWALSVEGDPIEGGSWSQTFVTEYFDVTDPQVDILHLRLNGETFEVWDTNRGGLQWDFSDANSFVIGSPTSGHIESNVSMSISFAGESSDDFTMDWAESYASGGGHATPYMCGTITRSGGAWTESSGST